jgi:DNA polymerase III sliding clamp (beta) subunit (PCNA family)
MLDALRTIRNDNIIISFVGEVKPILLKEENNENLICLILPIRTY